MMLRNARWCGVLCAGLVLTGCPDIVLPPSPGSPPPTGGAIDAGFADGGGGANPMATVDGQYVGGRSGTITIDIPADLGSSANFPRTGYSCLYHAFFAGAGNNNCDTEVPVTSGGSTGKQLVIRFVNVRPDVAPGNTCSSLCRDPQQGLWMAVYDGGQFKLRPGFVVTYTIDGIPGTRSCTPVWNGLDPPRRGANCQFDFR